MTAPGHLPSLLEDARPANAPPRSPRPPGALARKLGALRAHPRFRRRATIAGALAVAAIGVALYSWLRPVPQPDYASDGMDEIFNYTLLTDEFNALPVRERLELIGQLVARLKGLSAGDSALMAAFAAGIAGAAREQLEENLSRLAVDAWDLKAAEYARVGPEDREAFLKQAYADFQKMLEAAGGRVRDVPDEKRVEEGFREASRGVRDMQDPARRPDTEQLGRLMTFMESRVGGHANPAQRARGAQMLRDMSRMFRGEDVATGRAR